jgi:hypothetical protein
MSGFENNIINALNALIRSSMHSPNYVTGVSGWTINKDGSAEFSNLTIRGTFYGVDFIMNNQGLFFYSGVPANGNLVLAITAASGNDTFGNAYPQGLMAQQLTLPNQAITPPAFAGASVYYTSIFGRPKFLSSSGVISNLARTDINVSQFTQGASITPATVSSTLSYIGGEGTQSSEYELEIDGTIITTSGATAATLSFGVAIDGTIQGGQFTIGSVFLPIGSKGFTYTIRGRVTITGVGIANIVTDGQISAAGVNAGGSTTPVPTIAVGAVGTGKTFDSTINHSIQIFAFWGSVQAGEALTTFRTRVTRND